MSDIKLILGDCLEIMRGMPDASVDAVITDPPYGIGESSDKIASRNVFRKGKSNARAAQKNYGVFNWDNERLSQTHFQIMRRVSKHQIIFGGNYYTDYLTPSASWIVWDKLNGTNDFADCEMAWTSHKKAARMFRYMWNGMLKQKPEQRFHPTQKPLDLMLWIIERYTDEGDTILDCFMGSGTTGVACARLNRNFIGIEINPQYFEIAQRRIAEAQAQLALPMGAVG